ncbi:MAG TPA: histone-like nucleoid-structuring protein Lsr2 [Solirubrobacteraceae bacterium]|nr:histone-like nucleoid-structuring protein Lsr2 [Solirubrobacteraceae bacterium]
MELLVARNPDPASSLPFLLWLPLGDGLVFRTRGTWPRTSALYCHPVGVQEWPAEPEIVERVALRVCARRGAAIDVVCDRGREQRSQIVFTRSRGRDVVFWQSPRTRKQARPDVRVPTARAQGFKTLEIIVDAHERYPYRFAGQQVQTVKRALACGDYAVALDGRVVCAVERKSIEDLVSSLGSGRLRFALGELAGLPRAAVVVEDGYARLFAQRSMNGATAADGLAELQVRYPAIPIVYCESRKLAEEWTYRYLAAASAWARQEAPARARIGSGGLDTLAAAPSAPSPSSAELRAWARANGIAVSDRGRISQDVCEAWSRAHDLAGSTPERDGGP